MLVTASFAVDGEAVLCDAGAGGVRKHVHRRDLEALLAQEIHQLHHADAVDAQPVEGRLGRHGHAAHLGQLGHRVPHRRLHAGPGLFLVAGRGRPISGRRRVAVGSFFGRRGGADALDDGAERGGQAGEQVQPRRRALQEGPEGAEDQLAQEARHGVRDVVPTTQVSISRRFGRQMGGRLPTLGGG